MQLVVFLEVKGSGGLYMYVIIWIVLIAVAVSSCYLGLSVLWGRSPCILCETRKCCIVKSLMAWLIIFETRSAGHQFSCPHF